jgi:hypothetical protein
MRSDLLTRRLKHLHSNNFELPFFKARDDLAYQSSCNAIGFDHNKCLLFLDVLEIVS